MSRLVAGLTLNYRDPLRTRRCIDSLLDEGVDAVLVWDNSADDGNSAEELRAALPAEKPVYVVVSSENLGFAAGVNRGIDWIRRNLGSSRVVLINNDAMMLPGGVESLNAALDGQPRAAIAYPDIDHDGFVHGPIFYQRHLGLLAFERPLPGSFSYPSGCALMIDLERVVMPLFDEGFFMYGEDCFLGWQYRDTDALLHVPRVCVWHEGSASSGMASEFYETRLVAGHILLARKIARNRADLAVLLAGRGVALGMRALVRSVRYRNLVPLRALVRGWAMGGGDFRR